MVSNINKWTPPSAFKKEGIYISGDTIGDLKTSGNRLSVWKADTEEDIDDAVVALAASRDALQKLCYVLIDEKLLETAEINMSETIGDTNGISNEILKKHRDLIEIDFWKIGYLCEFIIDAVASNPKTVSEGCVKNLLEKYKNDGKIMVDQVKSKIKEKMRW